MTSRSSKSAVRGFETEIEKCREEGNWKRSVELALQLKARSAQHESLAYFLIGEGELEQALENWDGKLGGAKAVGRGTELQVARDWLEQAAGEAGRQAGVALDALLLLAKLQFAAGDANAALTHYNQAELSTLTEKELPVRSLRIVAESFAIRAVCVEELGQHEEAGRCVSAAAALGALWAQRSGRPAGPVLGGALAAAVSFHARDRPARAVAACRALLSAVEAPALSPLRLGGARSLAELLLRASGDYLGPGGGSVAPVGAWQPRRYTAPNQFSPSVRQEEQLLAVLLAEAMAARDAVLSQSPEFAEAREHALRQAVAVADLLAIVAAKWGLLCLLQEALERAMKFSFGVRHVWRQRALAAVAAAPGPGQPPPTPGSEAWEASERACAVTARACALAPDDVSLRLVLARAWRAAGKPARAVACAEEARALGGPLEARALAESAAGWQALAGAALERTERLAADGRALAALHEAARLDPGDHVTLHRLALQLARCSRLNEALDAARTCLWARPECPHGLRLTAALWSAAGAGPRGERALAAVRLARDQYPGSRWPLAALGALLARREPPAALSAGRALVALAAGPAEHVASEPSDALSARPSSAGSSAGCGQRPQDPRRAAAWLALAQLLLRLGRAPAAAGCVAEAAVLAPNSHLVFYTRGLVQAALCDWPAARLSFTDALALRPTHADSLLQLGGAMYALGWPRLAEGALRAALSSGDGGSAEACRRLSLVLAALHEPLGAADAAAQALLALPATPELPLPASNEL